MDEWFSQLALTRFHDPDKALEGWACVSPTNFPMEELMRFGSAMADAKSALDHIAWNLFLACGGDPTSKEAKSVYFPNRQTPSDFIGTTRHAFPNAPADILEVFEAAQDYRNPQPHLSRLASFAVDRRHRGFAVVGTYHFAASVMTPPPPPGGDLSFGLGAPDPIKINAGNNVVCFVSWTDKNGQSVPFEGAPELPLMPAPKLEIGIRHDDFTINREDIVALPAFAEATVNAYERAIQRYGATP